MTVNPEVVVPVSHDAVGANRVRACMSKERMSCSMPRAVACCITCLN